MDSTTNEKGLKTLITIWCAYWGLTLIATGNHPKLQGIIIIIVIIYRELLIC